MSNRQYPPPAERAAARSATGTRAAVLPVPGSVESYPPPGLPDGQSGPGRTGPVAVRPSGGTDARPAGRAVAGKRAHYLILWACALGIALAEALVGYVSVRWGLILHFILLIALLIQAALVYVRPAVEDGRLETPEEDAGSGDKKMHRLYLALTLCPLIRILSLTIPLKGVPLIYWYVIIAFPLLVAAFVVLRLNGYTFAQVGLTPGNLPVQLAIGLVGIPLGVMENRILQPAPLINALTLQQIWLPALILLIFTGFFEELIFRGLLQKAARDVLGGGALPFVAFLFAVLHITHLSVIDIFFVFGVAVLFYWFALRTRSILGVTLAHGLTNIGLYLVWPFILGRGTGM